ncbi:MAG: sigma 54-interacting transcriptional regulator [Acidobacteriota bacterium]|nr:sigma 54-interacting transcriptional regulator [Acidobacteriota bacterium]
MFRLVAYAPDGVQRFPVHSDRLLIGSHPDCDVFLPYTGVAQEHARLMLDGRALRIEDLGSRKGTVVAGERVREASLEVLDEIRLGGVTLLVEDVAPEPANDPEPPPVEPPEACIDSVSMVEHLSRLSDWVLADPESRTSLESLAGDLLQDFGGGLMLLFQGEVSKNSGVKFTVATDATYLSAAENLLEQLCDHREAHGEEPPPSFDGELLDQPAWMCHHLYRAMDRPYFLALALPRFRPDGWGPESALRTVGDLLILGLVHHVGHYEPILPGKQGRQNLVLDPGLVVGESKVMLELVEQLKGAVDPPVQVLLRGEAGSGRELCARSLHLSGSRRHGPFIIATAGGAKPGQLEADLFGAEIPGKDGPVRRQGKLQLADGGTLYLEDVDLLPLDLQARLVRFLRTGEVEPAGSQDASRVDVRLIVASRGSLEALVARDQMRVDLAYRLSQLAIDVPPLRDRREDLTLLIQSHINRFCHEQGKRVQGIAVKAFKALLNYDYPGNLPELGNIARQLVYLCPSGQPIDVNLLPERVRTSTIRSAARIDRKTELNLERLVADCERAAIREALRRSQGNKSQAARDLGLSRNGLAMKMQRYGLHG